MKISFANSRLEDICTNEVTMQRALGTIGKKKLKERFEHMEFHENLEQLKNTPGHWHELAGGRWGQIAVRLHGPYRLIIEPSQVPVPKKPDGRLDWKRITEVQVIEIVDYHD